jgi:hypothetical protein
VITLLDDDRSETYATLDEAIRAAQTWYIGLAGGKLPSWNYRVESLLDFRRAIGHHKSQIAKALGCPSNRLKDARLARELNRMSNIPVAYPKKLVGFAKGLFNQLSKTGRPLY